MELVENYQKEWGLSRNVPERIPREDIRAAADSKPKWCVRFEGEGDFLCGAKPELLTYYEEDEMHELTTSFAPGLVPGCRVHGQARTHN